MTAAEFAGRVQGSKGSNPLDCALHFYRLGMSVIPVPRPSATGDGKTPPFGGSATRPSARPRTRSAPRAKLLCQKSVERPGTSSRHFRETREIGLHA